MRRYIQIKKYGANTDSYFFVSDEDDYTPSSYKFIYLLWDLLCRLGYYNGKFGHSLH